ncbi:unnamed protein product [Microthlaspi erraticum]|uniref:U6 small nuclear RNA (adenine-(43)-N(6))-methyltransferase n=1 Tax=Microthlaspi erraticum TaxID=1685480 RepID=A0A6D2IJ25_9BRAS|nr:unnamed protein product [Microthlaspi erraticum]
MRNGKKRARSEPGSTNHPRNKYSDNPPDFALLASLYPSFKPFVFFSGARARIDWTDYNATRELTRTLLVHDHGLNWWIPDGQLCPTVPNRSNYIHWINDLLSSELVGGQGSKVKGFDIGTGANCIYPLLGASLFGWTFVGSDVTAVALEWAEKNVQSNPHISDLIEIRDSNILPHCSFEVVNGESDKYSSHTIIPEEAGFSPTVQSEHLDNDNKSYTEPAILVGLVKEDETFDFCMSNPPFFETFEEAGLNPKTSCGGTPQEMVCNGGEQAFVTRIIQDSTLLRQRFRWYTSMLGKKANLKLLTSKLWEAGVTVVKSTEFLQGQTSRWGIAWSFMPTVRKIVAPPVAKKSVLSFMLEGIKRQYSAIDVLQSVEEFFKSFGASCKLNSSAFSVDIVTSSDQCNTITKISLRDVDSVGSPGPEKQTPDGSSLQVPQDDLSFRILVFQQMPGTLLIKGSLQQKDSPLTGLFSLVLGTLEESMKSKFCRIFSLRELLFLDDSTMVKLGYSHELDKALRCLAFILLPSFLIELVHKSIFFSSAEVSFPFIESSCAVLNFVMFLLVLLSWVYRTGVFLLVCVLFRLTCELLILRFRGLHKMFHRCGSDTVEDVCKEHKRIKKQLSATSHRYRFFIIASFVVISTSQFVALLLVLASKSDKSFLNSGDLVVCSAVQLCGFFLCLLGAARITHRAQGVVCIATRWHMTLTCASEAASTESDTDSSDNVYINVSSSLDLSSFFQARQALVEYLRHNNKGITLYGYALDRGLLHTLFAFEFSLVMWILSKVVVLS